MVFFFLCCVADGTSLTMYGRGGLEVPVISTLGLVFGKNSMENQNVPTRPDFRYVEI